MYQQIQPHLQFVIKLCYETLILIIRIFSCSIPMLLSWRFLEREVNKLIIEERKSTNREGKEREEHKERTNPKPRHRPFLVYYKPEVYISLAEHLLVVHKHDVRAYTMHTAIPLSSRHSMYESKNCKDQAGLLWCIHTWC